jgi:hypothetical protein
VVEGQQDEAAEAVPLGLVVPLHRDAGRRLKVLEGVTPLLELLVAEAHVHVAVRADQEPVVVPDEGLPVLLGGAERRRPAHVVGRVDQTLVVDGDALPVASALMLPALDVGVRLDDRLVEPDRVVEGPLRDALVILDLDGIGRLVDEAPHERTLVLQEAAELELGVGHLRVRRVLAEERLEGLLGLVELRQDGSRIGALAPALVGLDGGLGLQVGEAELARLALLVALAGILDDPEELGLGEVEVPPVHQPLREVEVGVVRASGSRPGNEQGEKREHKERRALHGSPRKSWNRGTSPGADDRTPVRPMSTSPYVNVKVAWPQVPSCCRPSRA